VRVFFDNNRKRSQIKKMIKRAGAMQLSTSLTSPISNRLLQRRDPSQNRRSSIAKPLAASLAIGCGLLLFTRLSEEQKASIGQYFTSIPWGILNGAIAAFSLKDFLNDVSTLRQGDIEAKKIGMAVIAFTLLCLDVCAVITDFPELGYTVKTGETTAIGDITNKVNTYNPLTVLLANFIKIGLNERSLNQGVYDSMLFIFQTMISETISLSSEFLTLNQLDETQLKKGTHTFYRFLSSNAGDAFINIMAQLLSVVGQVAEPRPASRQRQWIRWEQRSPLEVVTVDPNLLQDQDFINN